MGAQTCSRRYMDTADRTLATVAADQAGNVAPQNANGKASRAGNVASQDANSKALLTSLRDDEPMVLPTSHDEGLPG